jgi:hypothetical protein
MLLISQIAIGTALGVSIGGLFLKVLWKKLPVHKTRAGVTPQDDTEKEGNGPPEQVAIIPNAVPPPPPRDKSEYCRYPHTPWWKTLAELIGIGAVVWYACITHNTWKEIQMQTGEMQRQTGILRDQANSTFAQNNRAWVWVTMPTIHLAVGKPISTTIQVFNYGGPPVLVREPIMQLEVASGAIEKFKQRAKYHADTLRTEDAKDIFKVILPSHGDHHEFPVESSTKIATQEDYRKIMDGIASGSIDVTIYGSISYTQPGLPRMDDSSIFCFYLLKDGRTSACPNEVHEDSKQDEYTNWIE